MDIKQLRDAPELLWLKGKSIHATPMGIDCEDKEYKRTWCSVNLLQFVMDDNYEAFCECQAENVRITRKSFDRIREFVKSILKTDEDEKAMAYYLIINDLGKIDDFVQAIKNLGIENVDHDVLMYEGLRLHPELSPSFAALDKKYQDLILEGMKASFNFGQFVQCENLPGSLLKLKSISREALNFYMIHVLFDIAGAAGHVKKNGSLVVNEVYTNRFFWALDAIYAMYDGTMSAERAYKEYLMKTMEYFGLFFSLLSPTSIAIARLCNLLLVNNPDDAKRVEKAFYDIPVNTRLNLEKELCATGLGTDTGILLYYLPATLQNAWNFYKKTGDYDKAIASTFSKVLPMISKIYSIIRFLSESKEGVIVVLITAIAKAAIDPEEEVDVISVESVCDDFVVTTGENPNACLTFRAKTQMSKEV